MTQTQQLQLINDKYVKATRIPSNAFIITSSEPIAGQYGTDKSVYTVIIDMAKLPKSYCTVSCVCVSETSIIEGNQVVKKMQMLERFVEKTLNEALQIEECINNKIKS